MLVYSCIKEGKNSKGLWEASLLLVEKEFSLDAKCNLTKLLLVLRAYYADNKNLPSTIEELMTNYIDRIPEDPFDNKNLRYSKSNKIIYSIDSDMKDNKGDRTRDLCIELNF